MLRILHLDDCHNDAILVEYVIEGAGIKAQYKGVKNRQDFVHALELCEFDLILADSSVPDLDTISALKIAREKYPCIEFICLSGQENPAHIKASFDAGANDYISKNNLSRLITVLRRIAEEYEHEC